MISCVELDFATKVERSLEVDAAAIKAAAESGRFVWIDLPVSD